MAIFRPICRDETLKKYKILCKMRNSLQIYVNGIFLEGIKDVLHALHIQFTHGFSALCCILEVHWFVDVNRHKYFQNTVQCR